MMEAEGEQIIEFWLKHTGWWMTEAWLIGMTPPPSIFSIGIGARAGITSLILRLRQLINRTVRRVYI